MKYEQLKANIKSFEEMYPNGPLFTTLQQARLAIIDLETEVKELRREEDNHG